MKKRILSCMLTMVLAVSMMLSGCGDRKETKQETEIGTEKVKEEGNENSKLKDGEMTELLVVFPAPNASPPQLKEVEEAINAVVQETIDAKIKLQIIEWGPFSDQINLMLSSGEKLDIFFASSNIQNMANRGQLLPITDLVETYAPETMETMGQFMDACYFGGELYGFPTYRDLATQFGLVCRRDILEETGIKAEDIKTWDDIEALLAQVKETHPNMYPLIPADRKAGGLTNYNGGVFDIIETSSGVGTLIDSNGDGKIISIYETDEYMELAQKAYDWNKSGYFMPDSTTSEALRQDLIRADSAFSFYGRVHPGTVTQETTNSGKDMVTIPISNRILTTSGVNFCQWILPTQCENPQKALAFLNLLYSNSEIQNLFKYGIEGVNYEIKDKEKGIAGYPDGVDSSNSGWGNESWMTGNASVGHIWETDSPNIWEDYNIYNTEATKSPLYGFVFDSSNVQNEIAASQIVRDKYTSIIEAGLADPKSTTEKLNKELKEAGVQKIIDEMQKQVDAWMSSK